MTPDGVDVPRRVNDSGNPCVGGGLQKYRIPKFFICSSGPYFDVTKKRTVLGVPGNLDSGEGWGS